MSEPRLRLTGYTDADAVVDAFGSQLVDVVHVDEVTPEGIFVVADVGIDLGNAQDREWASGLIRSVLDSVGQTGVAIEPT